MDHHRHVDVVERAEADELLLARHQSQGALLVEAPSELHVDELLRRHGDQGDVPCQRFHDLRGKQPHGGAQHHRRLTVVAAGVGSAGLRVGVCVLQDPQRVQLSDDRDRGTGSPALDDALQTCQGDAALVRHTEFAELLAHESGSLDLEEAGFRVRQDSLGGLDEPFGALVDCGLGDGF